MRLLVLSDVHGSRERTLDILRSEMAAPIGSHPDYLLFLGDGLRDIDELAYYGEFAALPVLSVRGNCDFFGASDTPELRELTLGGIRTMMMHGHRYGVKAGVTRAAAFAASKDCDLLLFGHTHIPRNERLEAGQTVGDLVLHKPLVLFNPGSVGYSGSFGLVTITDAGISCAHKQL